MRLTLRTMLAYLDDILDPEDAQQLGQKITESGFASDLVYRTLSSKRRTNLAAPRLDGTGIGSDPNSVAEYLDNTLDESRIPEFERICLESEMHLGEVASCHSILTKVMEEPVEVDPSLRANLVDLIHQRPAESEPAGAGQTVATDPSSRSKPGTTADYLPSTTHPLWRALVVLTFLALVTIIGLRAMGPLDENHIIIGPLFNSSPEVENETPEAGSIRDTPAAESPVAGLPTAPQNRSHPEGNPFRITDQNPLLADPPEISIPSGSVGEFLADHQLLVAKKAGFRQAYRLVSATGIHGGITYQSFPSYRPEMSMHLGVRMMLVGTSELAVGETEKGNVQFQLHHGCLVIRGENNHQSKVPLQIGDRQIDVYLGDNHSIFTAQVTSLSRGSDNPGDLVIQFHCRGHAQWQDRGIPAVSWNAITTAAVIRAYTIVADSATKVTAVDQLPRWVNVETTAVAAEPDSAKHLINSLESETNLVLGLRKAFESHRLLKVRTLAAHCLLQLGETDAIMDTLNDAEYRSTWGDSVSAIRRYVLRGAVELEQIAAALRSRVGDNTDTVLTMLRFLADEELQGEIGSDMVRGLESTVMLERVISFERLKEITGKTQMYSPERSPLRQVVAIRRWQQLWSEKTLKNSRPYTEVSVLAP